MMLCARFHYQLDLPAVIPNAFGQGAGIFEMGDELVGIAADMQQRDSVADDRFNTVHRIAVEIGCGFRINTVDCQASFPVVGASRSVCESFRPASDVANRVVRIQAAWLVRLVAAQL